MIQISKTEIETLLGGGEHWWWSVGDAQFYTTTELEPTVEGDLYCLSAYQGWRDQWNGDWQRCADALNEMFALYPDLGT